MNILQPYIYNLLQHNDCIVIPGFGAFIAREISAHYDDTKHVFVAPGKELSFNILLKEDDGVLVNQIALALKVSYNEAKKIVLEDVICALTQLETHKKLNIDNVGLLLKDEDDKLQFRPFKSRYDTIQLYGVQNSFVIKPLKTEVKELHVSELNVDIMKNKQIKIAVASVAAAILIGLFILFPNKNNKNVQEAGISIPSTAVTDQAGETGSEINVGLENENSVAQESSDNGISADVNDPTQQDAEFNVVQTLPEVSNAEVKSTNVISKSGYDYHIVIGSVKTNDLAQQLSYDFIQLGVDARVLECGERYRIVHRTFSDKSEAFAYWKSFKAKHPEYNDAWIFTKKVE